MIDLNARSELSARINWHIDRALEAEPEDERQYLGCSYLGEACERAAQYAYMAQRDRREPTVQEAQPYDAEHEAAEASGDHKSNQHGFPWTGNAQQNSGARASEHVPQASVTAARIRRIFQRGHDCEDRAAQWLQQAGLLLITADPLTCGQFELAFCENRVKGHADGVITLWRGQGPSPMPLPALWECKCLGHSYFRQCKKNGVRVSHVKYFRQMQLYMMGLRLEHGLLTCVDADTCELHHELVRYDETTALALIARAQRILAACDHGEMLPRSEAKPQAVACRMCRWSEPCWQ